MAGAGAEGAQLRSAGVRDVAGDEVEPSLGRGQVNRELVNLRREREVFRGREVLEELLLMLSSILFAFRSRERCGDLEAGRGFEVEVERLEEEKKMFVSSANDFQSPLRILLCLSFSPFLRLSCFYWECKDEIDVVP